MLNHDESTGTIGCNDLFKQIAHASNKDQCVLYKTVSCAPHAGGDPLDAVVLFEWYAAGLAADSLHFVHSSIEFESHLR